jgi:hypothetical protein
MSGGGKGDKQTSKVTLPPEIAALAKRNLENAEQAGKIGYVPYQGPTVAALNPMQINAMQQNDNAMKAFGMAPAGASGSVPKPTTYAGGVQGYDPLALYAQALAKINSWQKQQITAPRFQAPTPGAGAPTPLDRLGVPLRPTAGATPTPRPAAPPVAVAKAPAGYWDWSMNGGAGGFRAWGS